MLKLDLNCAVTGPVTRGASMDEIRSLAPRVDRCLDGLRSGGPWTGWVGLPADAGPAEAAARYADSLPGGITDAAILGIGGSSLGPLALYHAARHPFTGGGRRLHFMDNSDPDTVGALLDALDPRSTLFVAITKSGSTAETASQLLAAWDASSRELGDAARDHFVFITDPERGDLRALAGRLGVTAFDVPQDVGGRFSVLSAVGLVPAAIAGIDPLELLKGARAVSSTCLEEPLERNPAALLASIAFLMDTRHARHVHVMMAYSDRLAPVGAWFRQIWAESLGKAREGRPAVGPTPLDARGATDQHSLLQLLVHGPPDKLVIFLDVDERREIPIPALFEDLSSFGYLGGRTLASLIEAERRGTQMSLARAGTPSVTLSLDEVSPATVGGLLYLLEVATAVAGSLYEVNPYDQPGVEEGKKLACGLLGRPGYEQKRREAEEFEKALRQDLVIRL